MPTTLEAYSCMIQWYTYKSRENRPNLNHEMLVRYECMCVYMYMCMFVCTRLCAQTHTHTHIQKKTWICHLFPEERRLCMYLCVYVYTYVCVYVCMCMFLWHIHTAVPGLKKEESRPHVYMYVYVHTDKPDPHKQTYVSLMPIRKSTDPHKQTYVHTHTHAHTYSHRWIQEKRILCSSIASMLLNRLTAGTIQRSELYVCMYVSIYAYMYILIHVYGCINVCTHLLWACEKVTYACICVLIHVYMHVYTYVLIYCEHVIDPAYGGNYTK